MRKKYEINLSEEQRQELLDLIKKGSAQARTIRRARTLLMAAEGKTDEIIAKTLHVSAPTVERTRKQFCCENLAETLTEKKRSGKPKKLTNYGMVQSELSVLVRQCLQRKIHNIKTLEQEVSIWEGDRNLHQVGVYWHLRTEEARVKLSKIYLIHQN
jgi:transposase